MPRVAVLRVLSESDFEGRSWVNAFKQGLVALGWNGGLNVRIDVRAGGGDVNQMQKFAKELVDLRNQIRPDACARKWSLPCFTSTTAQHPSAPSRYG
jgi:hypothetical protein